MTVPNLSELRDGIRLRAGARPKGPALAHVTDLEGPNGLALRHYRPTDDERPLLVFVHGGAWVIGNLDTHDRTCRRIADACDVEVLAVDYRLAPEHPYPAAIEDVVEVVRRAKPVAVAGDSAGGYLATMACMRLRDAGEPLPAVQILICPNTDLTLSQASVEEKGSGHGLDADFLAWAVTRWTPDPAVRAQASPLLVPDLYGMPDALIVTAEHDALRDEGDAYARRLAQEGARVVHRQEAGLVHGFIQNMDLTSPEAAAAHDRLFADIASLIHGSAP
ncbi:alpha/beta hydrolase [Microtetraspora sp. AC03309]|uniref:alpha/beta hydrolase n=1 Tax=Microtetraspora sp. AC03309 TaxID=2779376 RepID=UPI001E57A391|nr:alpha/beta hydrolase [Microtetraspora sp. AC03309]MCC5580200.1 alpha/beta hydrolase [Microtetraspora sp. AC03309]